MGPFRTIYDVYIVTRIIAASYQFLLILVIALTFAADINYVTLIVPIFLCGTFMTLVKAECPKYCGPNDRPYVSDIQNWVLFGIASAIDLIIVVFTVAEIVFLICGQEWIYPELDNKTITLVAYVILIVLHFVLFITRLFTRIRFIRFFSDPVESFFYY